MNNAHSETPTVPDFAPVVVLLNRLSLKERLLMWREAIDNGVPAITAYAREDGSIEVDMVVMPS